MSSPITITCPSCSRSIKVPLRNADITPESYAQVNRYAQRADGGRSMNESEEALLTDLERVTAERDTLHDRIENALAEALGNPVMSIHDGDGPTAPDLESLIKLAGQIHRERTELRLTLAAERGLPEGAVSEGWASFGGLLREWQKRYPDGTEAQVRADGRWWRGYRGELPSWPDRPGRRAQTIAEGPAGLKRAGMLAADAALSGEG